MTDDYNLAKPDPTTFSDLGSDDHNPFIKDPQTGLPPYMVNVNLPEPGTLAPGEPTLAERIEAKRREADATGFVVGEDRMNTAPEFLADKRRPRGHLPFDGPPVFRPTPHVRRANQFCVLCESGEHFPITKDTSDGRHTFDELYAHRRALTAALMAALIEATGRTSCWRSRLHHPEDGPMFDESFIVGVETPMGPITYHYNNRYWDDFNHVPELPHSPKWDGAGPELTITRLLDFARR